MKVRIGFGPAACRRARADDAPASATLVDDARSAAASTRSGSRSGATGADARPDRRRSRSRPGARTKLKLGTSVQVLPGPQPGAARQGVGEPRRALGRPALPAFGLGVVDPREQQAFGVAREERAAVVRRGAAADPPALDRGRRRSRRRRASTTTGVARAAEAGAAAARRVARRPGAGELRRVGRLGDGWLPSFSTPAEVAAGRVMVRRPRPTRDARSTTSTSARWCSTRATRSPSSSQPGSRPAGPTSIRRPRPRGLRFAAAVRLEQFLDGFSKLVLVPRTTRVMGRELTTPPARSSRWRQCQPAPWPAWCRSGSCSATTWSMPMMSMLMDTCSTRSSPGGWTRLAPRTSTSAAARRNAGSGRASAAFPRRDRGLRRASWTADIGRRQRPRAREVRGAVPSRLRSGYAPPAVKRMSP